MERKELIELIKKDIQDIEENNCDDLKDRMDSWITYIESD